MSERDEQLTLQKTANYLFSAEAALEILLEYEFKTVDVGQAK